MGWEDDIKTSNEVVNDAGGNPPDNSWGSKPDKPAKDWGNKSSGGWSADKSKWAGSKKEHVTENPYVPRLPLFVTYLPNKNVAPELHQKVIPMLKFLVSKGFIVRYGLNDDVVNTLLQESLPLESLEAVKPWYKYEPRGSKPIETRASCSPRSKALMEAEFNFMYQNVPEKVKPFAEVPLVCILGSFLNTPVQLMITVTPDGVNDSESASKETGDMRGAITIADKCLIPIINLTDNDYNDQFGVFVSKLK